MICRLLNRVYFPPKPLSVIVVTPGVSTNSTVTLNGISLGIASNIRMYKESENTPAEKYEQMRLHFRSKKKKVRR